VRTLAIAGEALLRRPALAAFAGYLLASIALTWPTVMHPGSMLFGDYGDRRGHVWGLWTDAHGLREGPTTALLGAPYGMPVSQVIRQPFFEGPEVALSWLWNEVVAANAMTIAGFALTATATFVLLHRLLGRAGPAFLGGLAFGFCPAAVLQSVGGHGEYEWAAFVPLFMLSLFHNREARTLRSAAGVGLAFAGILLVSIYTGYFSIYLGAAFVVFDLVARREHGIRHVALNYLAAGVIAGLALLPFHWRAVAALFHAGGDMRQAFFSRNFGDLFTFSSRLGDYLVPSLDHPVLGRWTEPFARPRIRNNAFEQTLYLGVVPMLLVAAGSLAIALGKWRGARATVFAFFVAAAAWMFLVSFPPRLPASIPNVSEFAYRIFPFFRVYARAGLLVMLLMACAAAFALAHLTAPWPARRQAAACGALTLALMFEFWSVPPNLALPVAEPPAVYRWLAAQPGDKVVAEYPMMSFDEASFYTYPFWQRIHGKRLVNGAAPSSPDAWSLFQKVQDLSDPGTPALLKSAGVDYVIVHPSMYADGPIPRPLKRYYAPGIAAAMYGDGRPPAIPDGLVLQQDFGTDRVYALR
jgi:hypothetical protein